MMRSPRSASATSSARNCAGAINSVSTSPSARPSTSATRPDNWPISARNCPGPWSITGVTWPRPSRWVMVTWPDKTIYIPGPGLPVSNSLSPSLKLRISANRRTRAISGAVRVGKVCSWRGKKAARSAPGAIVVAVVVPSLIRISPIADFRSGYSSCLLAPSSYGEGASVLEGAAGSPRPRACDLRRLRFSRSASFNRSCR